MGRGQLLEHFPSVGKITQTVLQTFGHDAHHLVAVLLQRRMRTGQHLRPACAEVRSR